MTPALACLAPPRPRPARLLRTLPGAPPVRADDVWVSNHAMERLHELHPSCGVVGACRLLSEAEEVAPEAVAPLLGRRLAAVRDRYFLAADRRGVFVVQRFPNESVRGWTLVTFLRFGPQQTACASRLWEAA